MKTTTFIFAAIALCANASAAITLGQIDTFEDGTEMGWRGDQGTPPINIATGGPRGTDDNYLEVFAGVGGASHLATYNGQLGQWTGNWTAAGVSVVEVHVRNEGPDAVNLRAVWFGQFGSRYTSTIAVPVPADGRWRKIAFPCRQGDLTQVLNAGETYAQVMTDVERFMFRHDSGAPSSGGDNVSATLGIDNVEASNKGDFEPDSFVPIRGVRTGDLFHLLFSDDQRMEWRPGVVFTTQQSPAEFRVISFSTIANPTAMSFNIEGHATAASIQRKIELLNRNTGLFDIVAPFVASSLSDQLTTISVNPADYLDPATGRMEARIGYKAFGPVISYPWRARQDRIFFRITP